MILDESCAAAHPLEERHLHGVQILAAALYVLASIEPPLARRSVLW